MTTEGQRCSADEPTRGVCQEYFDPGNVERHGRLYRQMMASTKPPKPDPEISGATHIIYMKMGLWARLHVDDCHSGHVNEAAETLAPSDGWQRDAWLFGYRFPDGARPHVE